MRKYTTSIILLLLFCYACSNDDDATLNDNSLAGEWNLTKVLCFCDEIPSIPAGDQVWKFETKQQNLKVTNNVSEPYLANGEYSYMVKGDGLFIDNPNSSFNYNYKFFIKSDTLRLEDKPELDGPILLLVKN